MPSRARRTRSTRVGRVLLSAAVALSASTACVCTAFTLVEPGACFFLRAGSYCMCVCLLFVSHALASAVSSSFFTNVHVLALHQTARRVTWCACTRRAQARDIFERGETRVSFSSHAGRSFISCAFFMVLRVLSSKQCVYSVAWCAGPRRTRAGADIGVRRDPGVWVVVSVN